MPKSSIGLENTQELVKVRECRKLTGAKKCSEDHQAWLGQEKAWKLSKEFYIARINFGHTLDKNLDQAGWQGE